MKASAAIADDLSHFENPSALMLNYADEIKSGPNGPVLEIGCGYGRNALALARSNIHVIAVDKDITRLHALAKFLQNEQTTATNQINAPCEINIVCADLLSNSWPIAKNSLSGILCVHFPDLKAVGQFHAYIKTGGWLCIETFGSHGENYRQLPLEREVYEALKSRFTFLRYREKRVGPHDSNAVTVKLFARKRAD